MNDKQIISYCMNIVLSNLQRYSDKPEVLAEIYELNDKKNKKAKQRYLEHFKGLRELFDKAIDLLEKEGKKDE